MIPCSRDAPLINPCRHRATPRSAGCIAGLLAALIMVSNAAVAAAANDFIAVAGPASGRQAALLDAIAGGAARALAEARDSPHPPPAVRLLTFDDECGADSARKAAAEIAAKAPALVVGHPCPAAAIAAAPVYAKAGIPFIAIGVRHPDLTQPRAGPSVFRLAGRDDRQGEAAAQALIAAAPGRRIAIIQDRTAYARGLLAQTSAALVRAGVTPGPVVPIVAGRRDYDREVAPLSAAGTEAVFFAGYPSEATVVLRSLRKAGLNSVLIGSDATATREFADAIANVAAGADGVRVLAQARAGSPNPPASGDELEILSGAAVEAWLAAVRRAGLTDALKVIAELAAGNLEPTRLGVLSFDPNGDARLPSFTAVPLIAGEWKSGASLTR